MLTTESVNKLVAFEDFQQVLMETTLQKLKKQLATYNRNHRRVRNNITAFLRTLIFQNRENSVQAVHRFQTKLTLGLTQKLWSTIRTQKKVDDSNMLLMSQFLSYLRASTDKTYFHDYEFEFCEEIFKRMVRNSTKEDDIIADNRTGVTAENRSSPSSVAPNAKFGIVGGGTARMGNLDPKVDVFHLMLFLVFISPESDKQLRFECVFRIFDTDDDGCLTQDQILKLYTTIRLIIPILSEDHSHASDANLFFNDEIALQEGARAFQFTMDLFSKRNHNSFGGGGANTVASAGGGGPVANGNATSSTGIQKRATTSSVVQGGVSSTTQSGVVQGSGTAGAVGGPGGTTKSAASGGGPGGTTLQTSNLLTYNELWAVFEYAPYLVDNLIPGMVHIKWVLAPDIVDSTRAAARMKKPAFGTIAHKGGGPGGGLLDVIAGATREASKSRPMASSSPDAQSSKSVVTDHSPDAKSEHSPESISPAMKSFALAALMQSPKKEVLTFRMKSRISMCVP